MERKKIEGYSMDTTQIGIVAAAGVIVLTAAAIVRTKLQSGRESPSAPSFEELTGAPVITERDGSKSILVNGIWTHMKGGKIRKRQTKKTKKTKQ